jgi:hypothetical protein
VNDNVAGALAFGLILGIVGTVVGGWYCVKGHNYAVAAQYEATIPGRVIGMLSGKGGPSYHYVFSINEVELDDYSDVCATAIVPGACDDKGQCWCTTLTSHSRTPALKTLPSAALVRTGSGSPCLQSDFLSSC